MVVDGVAHAKEEGGDDGGEKKDDGKNRDEVETWDKLRRLPCNEEREFAEHRHGEAGCNCVAEFVSDKVDDEGGGNK